MTNKERIEKIFALLTEAAELTSDMDLKDREEGAYTVGEFEMKVLMRDYFPHLEGRILEATMWAGVLRGLFDGQGQDGKTE